MLCAAVTSGWQLLGIAALASAISMWLTGKLTNFGKKNVLITLYLIRLIAFIWLASSTSIWQLVVFAIVYGVSSIPIIPLVTGIIGDRFGKNALGSILGSSWLLHQIFAALGVFLGGYLRTASGSYSAAFWAGAFILGAGTILTLFLRDQDKLIQTKPAQV